METIVGLLIWGGLLVLVIRWVVRTARGVPPKAPVAPTQPAASPPARPAVAHMAVEDTPREAEALVDGLIIGHYLTRTHYEDRLDEQAEVIDALRTAAADDTYFGDDDVDEHDDLEDGRGSGAGGFADGFGQADGDEFDGFGAADDPWGDVFGDDEDD
jgi:hypothetical protein